MNQPPSPYLSSYPIENVDGNLFPPVCLRTHWDPTAMLRHILPQQKVGLPQDFRPWVKVCKKYVTSGPAMEAPLPPKNMVFPMGGEFYPPGRYSNNIDKESVLRTLDHPVDKWCPSDQYIPSQNSNMYVSGTTLPERKAAINDAFISELAMPQVLLRLDSTTCRSENDTKYFERSGRLFNNPTKQDRYGANKFYALPSAESGRGDPMPHGGVNQVRPTRQAVISRGDVPQPGGEHRPTRHSGYGSTINPGTRVTPGKGCTSFVGVSTCDSAAPVW